MHEPRGGSDSWEGPYAQPDDLDNPAIPAGYTYFGQFVDHDITFDPASSLQRENDPDALTSFRTPGFDLDSVYGSGPADEPFRYDRDEPTKLLLGESNGQLDLPRNAQGVALIGDARNDENLVVSQLQLVFLRLHNELLDEVAADARVPADRRFEEAQQRVRWHYQWVVIHDYLRRLVGEELLERLFPLNDATGVRAFRLAHYRPRRNAYIPVEFSVAAYRFGHSQVRSAYHLNDRARDRPLFVPGDQAGESDDLRGLRPLPIECALDWKLFLPIEGSTPQPSRRIDALLAAALFDLPGRPVAEPQSLAERNLRRGQAFGLPSGQDVARLLGAPHVLSGAYLGGVPEPTPLWFYILKESELTAADPENPIGSKGTRLGPVGARIVAEVFLGLLRADAKSYVNMDPKWQPTIPAANPEEGLTLADLVRHAVS